jgi:hypothetical protein
MTVIADDHRKIHSIIGDDLPHITSGELGVTKIVAYDDTGDMAYTPWLAVYKDDQVWLRLRADRVI